MLVLLTLLLLLTLLHGAAPCLSLPAVDRSKRPVDIPFELAPETQAEQLRHRLAVQKRGERLALRDCMRQKIRVSLDGQTTDRWDPKCWQATARGDAAAAAAAVKGGRQGGRVHGSPTAQFALMGAACPAGTGRTDGRYCDAPPHCRSDPESDRARDFVWQALAPANEMHQ